jgi:dephospho-CoA kinase
MKPTPLLIGLTGSIGMGKTTTAKMFAYLGIPVWDADKVVHKLYSKMGQAVEPIKTLFPNAICNDEVNRETLKQIIKENPKALKQIESIVHPLVQNDRKQFIKSSNAKIILLDIPLLFENGYEKQVDVTVVVTAPVETQRTRVMQRQTMTEDMFQSILAKQMPDDQKQQRADYVIETTSLGAAKQRVQQIVQELRKQINA